MYHFDGHRICGVRFSPEETAKHKGICPVCKKPLVIGVMNRVNELADRPDGTKPKGAPDFRKLVELDKIIAEAMNIKSRSSKAVQTEYRNIVKHAGPELFVLLDASLEEIEDIATPEIAEGVRRVREGKLAIEPGFDGQYGTVRIFTDEERENSQQSLF
jgi:PHP family Zn ribbon phosphoesterase